MNRTKQRGGKGIRIGLLILFGVSFAVSVFMSSRILLERKAADDAYASLRMNAQTAAVTVDRASEKTGGADDRNETKPDGDGTADIESASVASKVFKALRKQSRDSGEKIFAKKRTIDEPAVQTDKNGYCRKHLCNSETGAADDRNETKPDGAKDAEAVPVQLVSMDFEALREQCTDIRAWIFSEGTVIDYPVVQTDNNDYYQNHLYNGKKNSSGALFLDYRNTGLFTEKNTVIYGHNMKNGSMFGSLILYKKQNFYDKHPTMFLYTPNGDYLIELVCGTVEDGNNEFVRFEFEDENDFYAYIDSRRSSSTFQSDVEIEPEDRIVSLCTCSYERNNARYMLIGKLTPIMEDSIQ